MATHHCFGASRSLFVFLAVIFTIGVSVREADAKKEFVRPPVRYTFKIDPATKITDLLPAPPRTLSASAPYLNEDLARVAELALCEPPKLETHSDAEKETANAIAKIHYLNRDDPDGFLKSLMQHRAELRGLPFLMGKDCQTDHLRAVLFAEVTRMVHASESVMRNERFVLPEDYWKVFDESWKELRGKNPFDAPTADVNRAKVAALVQVFDPAPEPYRAGLAKYLATIPHPEAARALAKMALFAPEESVRKAAIQSLKKQSAPDYLNTLMHGFRYPLPAVSRRAADALVELKVDSVLPDLVTVLEEPDPRAPTQQKIEGEVMTVVRELVRVNHHRNCLLCHAPAHADRVERDLPTAAVPLPNRALSRASGGYGRSASPDIFVRTDVTYLRQDFSMMMRVEKAEPWPEMQRFDFLVRTRVLTPEEATECERQIAKLGKPPSHLAAQHALRLLTGRAPANPTPQEWRRLLKLS